MPKGSTRARIPGRAGLSAELQTKLEALDKLTDALTFGLLHEYEAVKRMFLQERPNESFDDLLKPETVHIVIDQRKGYARVQRWRKRLRDSDWKLKADSFLLHFDQHAHDSWRFLKGLVEFSQITTFDTALPFLQEAHSFRVGRKHPDQRVWAPRDIKQALDMFKSQVDMRHSTVDIAPGTDSEPMSAASSDDEHEQGRFTEADEVGAQISDGLDEYSLVSPHHIATAKSEAVRHSPDSPVPVRESLPPLTSGDASTGGRLVRLRDSSPHVNLSYQPAAQDASENAMDGTISVLDQDPDRTDVEAVTGPPHAIATEKSKVAHHSPDSPVPVKESSQLPALTSGDASTGGRLTHILDSSSHMNPSHQPAAQDAFENAMDGTITVLVQDPDRTDMEAVPDPKAKQRVEQLQSSAQPRRSDLTGALGSLQGSSWLSSTAIELVLAFFTRDRDYRVLDPSFLPVASPLSLADKPPISLRQQKWVLVPMHHDSHWTVGFLDLGTGVIEYYDSLSRELAQARRALLCLGNYFSLDSPRLKDIVWRVEAKASPQQLNSSDCGVHVLVTCLYKCGDIPMPQYFDCSVWRSIFYTILAGTPLPPSPQTVGNSLSEESSLPAPEQGLSSPRRNNRPKKRVWSGDEDLDWRKADAGVGARKTKRQPEALMVLAKYEQDWHKRDAELDLERAQSRRKTDFFERALRTFESEAKDPGFVVDIRTKLLATQDCLKINLESHEELCTRLARINVAKTTAERLQEHVDKERKRQRIEFMKRLTQAREQATEAECTLAEFDEMENAT